jgi:hypothetical protein
VLAGSAVIAFHLIAIVSTVLAAESGPWPTNFGSSMSQEPRFARVISEPTSQYYLRPLHLAHNYHFSSNRNDMSVVNFEVKLRDEKGNLIKTLRFPDDNANVWTRQRQYLLALGLGDDQRVEPPRGESIPAPGQKVRMVTIWDAQENDPTLVLKEVAEHRIPRDRPVFRPTEWPQVLARAYSRYLCRQYGAASAEIIRHSRDPILPAAMFSPEPPPGAFDELVCSFGELRLEN